MFSCIDFDCILIMGAFNIHIGNPQDSSAIELSCILDSVGLTQHVSEPTHKKGHTLDLVITKGLTISSVVVTDDALSDHSCVFFEITINVCTKVQTIMITKRYITENNIKLFTETVSATPALYSNSVDDMVDHFSSKTRNLIDVLTPAKLSYF